MVVGHRHNDDSYLVPVELYSLTINAIQVDECACALKDVMLL